MKKKLAIKSGHNNLLIQLDGTQSFVGISSMDGDVLRISRSQGLKEFSYKGIPGSYLVDTDGEIKKVVSTKIEDTNVVSITIRAYSPQAKNVFLITINEELQELTVDELIKEKIISLKELKVALVKYFSDVADELRKEIITNDQLIYALLGVYSTAVKSRYKETVQAFETEKNRLTRRINSARTLKTLKNLRPNFPSRIIPNDKVVKKKDTVPKKKKIVVKKKNPKSVIKKKTKK